MERYHDSKVNCDQYYLADGPITTFTLGCIKDSPPYHHGGRLLTLEVTAELFNVVQQRKLAVEETQALVAFMPCLKETRATNERRPGRFIQLSIASPKIRGASSAADSASRCRNRP